jgi:hypothetical protein
MKTTLFLFLVVFAMATQVAQSADMPALIDRPAIDSGPTQVSVGLNRHRG